MFNVEGLLLVICGEFCLILNIVVVKLRFEEKFYFMFVFRFV